MPIYMDRHDVSEEVTAENVAQLHQADLKIQNEFGCRGLTYWFDEKRKTAFCLIEASDANAIKEMHSHAHGQIPHQIIEVEASIVESFLGRIEDPETAKNSNLNIINDPAFRTIMKIGLKTHSLTKDASITFHDFFTNYSQLIAEILSQFDGRIVKQNETDLLVSFNSVSMSLNCALKIQSKFKDPSNLGTNGLFNLKIGLSSGVPVTENKIIFEDTIKSAERMLYISKAEIVLSSEVKNLYKSENLNQFIEGEFMLVLSPTEELFLNRLVTFVEKEWKNNHLSVDDFNTHLGYSKSQLYRKMMELIGESPNNFLMSYRLDRALSLFSNETGNVSEIAFESGFSDPSYFSKCFHRKYGLSPSDYLRIKTN
jgi:AraC-like DNA-binding protein